MSEVVSPKCLKMRFKVEGYSETHAFCTDCDKQFPLYRLYQCFYCTHQMPLNANKEQDKVFYCYNCGEKHFKKEGAR